MASCKGEIFCESRGLGYGIGEEVKLGAVRPALGKVSWQWALSCLSSIKLAWSPVKQKYFARVVGQNKEQAKGRVQSGVGRQTYGMLEGGWAVSYIGSLEECLPCSSLSCRSENGDQGRG